MSVRNLRRVVLPIALLFGAAGCGGTETGNPGARVSLGIRASDPAIVDFGQDRSGNRVESLLLAVERAELVACLPADPPTALLVQPTIVDLVRGSPAATVPAGEYCGVRIELAPADFPSPGRDVPAVPAATVAAHGRRADGVAFTISSRTPRTILTSDTPFSLASGEAFIFAFDVSLWLGDGLLAAAPLVDGRATVDGSGELATQFEEQATAGLFEDRSGNGTIEPDEGKPVVATDPPATME